MLLYRQLWRGDDATEAASAAAAVGKLLKRGEAGKGQAERGRKGKPGQLVRVVYTCLCCAADAMRVFRSSNAYTRAYPALPSQLMPLPNPPPILELALLRYSTLHEVLRTRIYIQTQHTHTHSQHTLDT